MMRNNIENQVVDIDGYVHVINGKVICFKSDVFDLNNSEHVALLCEWFNIVRADDYQSRLYDDDTEIILTRASDGVRIMITTDTVCLLSDDIQEKVRQLQHEYQIKAGMMKDNIENQIVDIDGYIHVINGKMFCFEPDIYDLNNPEDVEYLCKWVSNMRTDNYLRKKYTDDTFVNVRKSSDGSHNIITSGSMAVYFKSIPEDVQKKVRSAIAEYQSKAGN